MEIDLNCDLGEGFGDYVKADDEGLMRVVSSANIACGFHAGSAAIMVRTLRLAKQYGVDVGAHPGYDDRAYFGRRALPVDNGTVLAETLYQLGALESLAREQGLSVGHLSFHGALGSRLYTDDALAGQLLGALARHNPALIIPATPVTAIERAARAHGLHTPSKFFADRAYTRDGHLAPRSVGGSVIRDPAQAARRVLQLLEHGRVDTVDGHALALSARIVVVHSDTPDAVSIASAVRQAVENAGGRITPLSRLPR